MRFFTSYGELTEWEITDIFNYIDNLKANKKENLANIVDNLIKNTVIIKVN